jgi:hypothetical protein
VRVLNDRDEKSAPTELGFFAIAAYSLFSSLGIATIFLAPLPMIAAHERLPEPWPKVTALLGALLALTYIQVPVTVVVATFVFALFVADTAKRSPSVWKLLGAGVSLAVFLGAVGFLVSVQMSGLKPWEFWSNFWESGIAQLQKNLPAEGQKSIDWTLLRSFVLHESPFVFVAGSVLSLWVSVGLAAHLGWIPVENKLSGPNLRAITLPLWLSILFLGLFIAGLFIPPNSGGVEHLVNGCLFLVGALMFIQGCIWLSNLMSKRLVAGGTKTFIYSLAIILGFYALLGVGVVSPWLFRRKEI